MFVLWFTADGVFEFERKKEMVTFVVRLYPPMESEAQERAMVMGMVHTAPYSFGCIFETVLIFYQAVLDFFFDRYNDPEILYIFYL